MFAEENLEFPANDLSQVFYISKAIRISAVMPRDLTSTAT
jgi:hypothetical protein